jgi:DUF1009 family protein
VKLGLIAGEGRFPLLVAEAARLEGHEVITVAIREEASSEIESKIGRCHWISLGELSRLIQILKQEGATNAVMAGRVRHARIYSAIRPDWRLVKLLAALPRKNTNALIGAVADVLAGEGITLRSSIEFLKPFLASEGPMTRRGPTPAEQADITYGREIAAALAAYDIGQTVVICERACVAVEAMEGTDLTILRAAGLGNGRNLTVVKTAKPNQDLRFDVPVVGPTTIGSMRQSDATALAVQAGQTLLIDKPALLAAADEEKIAVWGY